MKRKIILGLIASLTLGSPSCISTNTKSLERMTEEEFFASVDFDKNIGFLALEIEKKAGFDMFGYEHHFLEQIISLAKKKIDKNKEPRKVLKTIDGILRNDFGFKTRENIDSLSRSLDYGEKEFDCDTGSLLYLAIGQALDLPLHGVLAPEHLFIRWSGRNQNINWETTNAKSADDFAYRKTFLLDERCVGNKAYLKTLTKKEIIAVPLVIAGVKLARENKNWRAFKYFKKAVEFNPFFVEAWLNKANALAQIGSFDRALEDYKKALKLNPFYVRALYNKATVLMELKRYRKALDNLHQVTQHDSKHENAYFNKAFCLAHLKKPYQALENLETTLQLNPRNLEAYFNKGIILKNLGKYQKALESINFAIEINPEKPLLFYHQSIILKELNRKYEAAAAYRRFEYLSQKDWIKK